MADRVLTVQEAIEAAPTLPSRESAQAMLDGKLHEDDGALIVADILRLVASGRLVDREATIDYEAAYDRFDAILARPEPVTVDTIMANLDSIINAAVGV